MRIKPSVYTTQNEAIVVWKYDEPITHCIGFAIYKRTNEEPEALPTPLNNQVGFPDDKYIPGKQRPSTEWPIQRFLWNDYTVKTGDKIQYMIVPMLLQDGDLVKDENNISEWSDIEVVDTGTTYKAYFNRGLVASQFFARTNTKLGKSCA